MAEDVKNILFTEIPKGTPVKVDALGRGLPGRTLTIIAYHDGVAYATYLDDKLFEKDERLESLAKSEQNLKPRREG